jgi:[ribosomal protein S18]-alanine N-acetyltransferase
MIIREATAEDLAAIAAIQAASPEASAWNPADYLNYDRRVAVIEGRVSGFLVSRAVADGEREILNVAVAPADRRRGIARALVENELSTGPGVWFLEVRESNRAAINLYVSMGFEIAGTRPEYYHDPTEAAIVMRFFS